MFKEDSVDGILSVFNKTVEKLSALATKKSEEALQLQDKAEEFKKKSDAASSEAKRAVEAASRILAAQKETP